jgi:O-methyltransferase involved in polyketide biosynthesis
VHSAPSSTVASDYVVDAPDLMDRHGVKQAAAAIRSTVSAEPILFRIPEGTVETFLNARGFELTERLSTQDLEKRYLTLSDGTLVGRALASMRLVKAVTR